jgi:apolipoprotein N-acyltransferase
LYLEWLADTGVLGLGAFVWLIWRLARTLGGSLGQPANQAWLWQLALAASLTCWLLHGLTDYFYEPLPTNLGFWLIVGLALSRSVDLRISPDGGA